MAIASLAMFALPVLGYVVGSAFVAYVAVRIHGYIRQLRSTSVALPRPVNENVAKKSIFSFGRATGWDWRRWAFSIPWSRSPVPSIPKSKAAATAKNLTVELLPTTALPPPPTSIPSSTSTPQLVDLGSPPLPTEPTISSGFSSFPSSPRLPARPLLQPISHARGPKSIQHPSYPRPPSPHTLFTTTPPLKQGKRSRSLGGVPVRRLSGGPSGLRNAFDVELREFVPGQGHTRGTSREHLLIDLSSSDSSEDDVPTDPGPRISPAASDIGVRSVSSVPVKPIPVPLVDLGSDSTDGIVHDNLDSKDSWMWLGPSTPSIIRSYDARVLAPRLKAIPFSGEGKFVFPTTLPFPVVEGLVDGPLSHSGENFETDGLDSSKTLVDVESNFSEKFHPLDVDSHVMNLDDELPSDPFADDHAVGDTAVPAFAGQPADDPLDVNSQLLADGCVVDAKDPTWPLLHPCVDDGVYHKGAEAEVDQVSFISAFPGEELVNDDTSTKSMQSSLDEGLLFAEAESYPSAESHSDTPEKNTDLGSPWVSLYSELPAASPPVIGAHGTHALVALSFEADDPWGEPVHSMNFGVFTETAEAEQEAESTSLAVEGELAETSPRGSLLPTLLEGDAADDQVPELHLDDLALGEEPLSTIGVVQENDEEDVTPRPTPASVIVPLPIDDETAVPIIVVSNKPGDSLLYDANEQETLDEPEAGVYPDPDLLPLPDFLSSTVVTEVMDEIHESKDIPGCEQPSILSRSSSQMPTPPASPPSISSIRLSPVSPNPKKVWRSLPSSPHSRTKHLEVGGSITKIKSQSSPTSPLRASVILPSVEQENGKNNLTPVALVPKQLSWDAEPSDELETKHISLTKNQEEAMETMEIDEDEADKELKASIMSAREEGLDTALPGSFPEPSSTSAAAKGAATANSTSSATLASRLVSASGPTSFHPSVRAIVRQPVEIALAMQLRPGLGAGADPAWMVRFLMAMFGWFAVLVSGQENY